MLLCTYAKDAPDYLAQSINSILQQTLLPDEWIIVKDGPLPESLESILADISFPNKLKILSLPKNVTLGPARMKGTQAATHNWVALMDSDDICQPNRFEKQVALINADPNVRIIGGQIIEYEEIPGKALAVRNVPTGHEQIVRRAKKHNPFNAMTVMFKRDKAIEAGGFHYHPGFEDYDLWTRMIAKGAKCANHPDVLVHARTGNGMYMRRRGLSYIRAEWKMQRNLYQLGITNRFECICNLMLRIPIRLLPAKILGYVYEKFTRLPGHGNM